MNLPGDQFQFIKKKMTPKFRVQTAPWWGVGLHCVNSDFHVIHHHVISQRM